MQPPARTRSTDRVASARDAIPALASFAQRQIDRSRTIERERSDDPCEVELADAARLKQACELGLSLGPCRDQQYTARALVQAMHEQRAGVARSKPRSEVVPQRASTGAIREQR